LMFSLVSRKFLAVRNIALYSVYLPQATQHREQLSAFFTKPAQ
jgi:hypothetical protein